MKAERGWIRVVALLVPAPRRQEWRREWEAELSARGGGTGEAFGALADAWYLRTEGWSMDGLGRELLQAARGLTRKPSFTLLAGLTLAVGIGANTAIYSVVDAVLIDPLPFPRADRLVSYNHKAPGLEIKVPLIPHSEAMYLNYLEHAKAVEAFAVFEESNVNLLSGGEPRRLDANLVTQEYFDVLGVPPLLGRGFVPGEDRPGAEPVAVLSYGLWQESFGGDPSILGRSLEMDGVMRLVVGVMPRGFGLEDEDLWLPRVIDDADPDAGSLGLIGVARLKGGVSLEAADAEMGEILTRMTEEYPDDFPKSMMEQAGLAPDIKPLKTVFVEDIQGALWVVFGTVGFVLLIACANVANLFLVRTEGRQREKALRLAMGASRLDLLRQYLAESLLLATGAGVVGLALSVLGTKALLHLAPADLPNMFQIGVDGSVLAFTAAISLGAGVLFGLIPVLGRGGKDLSDSLREGGRALTPGRGRHRARSGLVVLQVAMALVLLVGSGLMLRSLGALRGVPLGFDPTDLLTFRFTLPNAEYPTPAAVLDFHRRLQERLGSIPGVQGVGMISGLPLTGAKSAGPMEAEDHPIPEGQLAPLVERRMVTPGFFQAMGIPVVDGRGPSWDDQGDQLRGVMVSATLANSLWPGESAVGRRIRGQGSESPGWEVMGVVGDIRHDAVADEPTAVVYLPVVDASDGEPRASTMDVVLRISPPLAAIPAVREAVRANDPRVPLIEPRTMESVVRDSMVSTSFTVLVLGIAAAIALLLGTVGIYGVISYVVGGRTQEIGVKMALGAPTSEVLGGVMKEGLVLIGSGVALGLLAALGAGSVIASQLYGVSPNDPLTLGLTTLLIVSVGALATLLPARRAAAVDPVQALRAEG